MLFRVVRTSFALCSLGLALACPSTDDGGADAGPDVELPDNVGDVAQTYADIVLANYEDTLAAAQDLDGAITTFLADPTAANLATAKDAWRAAREPYLQTEVFRFYEGPIDDEETGPEGFINAWPLDENYIDYTLDTPDGAGSIIAGTDTIDAATLESLNEQGGEANIATGYHAIEFLLWGQDTASDGPGDRPVDDYIVGTGANADRRRLYLETVSAMLVGHLQHLVDAWQPTGDTYAVDFVAAAPEVQLERIMIGMIVLAGFETGSERLKPALDNHDQEEEHSCFSDNTHRDMIQDIQGIQNVWRGSYDGVSGDGVKDVITALDEGLATDINQAIDQALADANALPVPFDQAIASGNDAGNAAVQTLIDQLFIVRDLLEDAFRAAGLDVPPREF